MKQTMLAAIFRGPREFEVTHIPVPEVGPDDVLLRVLACGICGSDLHGYRSAQFNAPGQIMGHEFAGEVVAVGPQVSGVAMAGPASVPTSSSATRGMGNRGRSPSTCASGTRG